MPTSAGLIYATVIRGSDGNRVDDMPFQNWYISSLSIAFRNKNRENVEIKKTINSKARKQKLLLLNTVDSTYGHSVFNLFNLDYYRLKKEYHLILLVQTELLWMVPEGVDEVWEVRIPFSKAGSWSESLSAEVDKEMRRFEEAFLCMAFPQPSDEGVRIEDYTRIRPFPLNEWDQRLQKPTITFIWRTDRFWKPVLPKILDNRYTRKLFPRTIKGIRGSLQFKWILKFASELRKKAPGMDFAVAGMDTDKRKLPEWIKDFRHSVHSDEMARKLCERYAESHLVIGCNGSSLVLPSCHAGAVMNIVPHHGWSVSVGSFVFRYTSIADTFYRYCLVHSETSIERMVKIAVQILRDRSMIELIAGKPWNDHDAGLPAGEWARFRKGIFENTRLFREGEGLISIASNK
jgi:hypothetical protein